MSGRRRSRIREAPQMPRGYRQTRRSSATLKKAKKAERRHRRAVALARALRTARDLAIVLIQSLGAGLLVLMVLLVLANGINTFARWNTRRLAERAESPAEKERRVRENVLYVGLDGERAAGYLALRVDAERSQVFGVAIPDGAFVDIPGLGFERIGQAWSVGPDTALATVSNFFSVPFRSYVAVPVEVYRDALPGQRVSGLVGASLQTNLSAAELAAIERSLASVPQKNVALVPMPVKPIKLGDQTYFEPQRDEIADVLKQWWGVDPEQGEQVTRVIVYNGSGVPGIAGKAAQQLIRAGFRVVDTKNADSFDYAKTHVIVKRGTASRGEAVKRALGVGVVALDITNADVTDVIVVIGKDFKPRNGVKGSQ